MIKKRFFVIILLSAMMLTTMGLNSVIAEDDLVAPSERCELNACDSLNDAADKLQYAYDKLYGIRRFHIWKKFQARKALAQAYFKIMKAQYKLLRCPLLGISISVDIDINILNPFLYLMDMENIEMERFDQNITKEILLGTAKLAILFAEKDSLGIDSEDALNDIRDAQYLVNKILEDIECP